MNNVAGATEVSISVFGGLNTELSPTDLPQGLSPACLNMASLPGSVFTRPSQRRFITVPNSAQTLYAKSFVKPDGTIEQIVFDSMGRFWANGVQFGSTFAGNRIKTTSAFGREYIAISDGLHGADVPLQWDGVHLDRISQDGPGGAPTISNLALAPVALVTGSVGAAITITSSTPINLQQVQKGSGFEYQEGYQPPQFEAYYTSISYVTATPHGLTAGQGVNIAGNSLYSLGIAYVTNAPNATTFEVSYYQQSSAVGTGGVVTAQSPLLQRVNNKVLASTAAAHNLRIGYRVNVSGVTDATQNLTSIVINNNVLSGIAVVSVATPHGFVPGNEVSLLNVSPVTLGGGFVSFTTFNFVATITTAGAHGILAGAKVIVSLGTGGIPVEKVVSTVPAPNKFTVDTPTGNDTQSVGSATLVWPAASGDVFAIIATPSPTTFEIPINYSNGTWTSGAVNFPWNGTFYVSAVPTATSFNYDQSGPNATINSGTGTVTPVGQAAAGTHKCVVVFQTRTGYQTSPSIPVTFTASGSQYVLVSDIPIGPSNVVARVLAFTSAEGGRYFYLPVAPQLNSEVIGTSTVVNDNITTSAVFDFSDQALLAASAIDIPGNNLFNQVVLGPCLGVFPYAGRMFAWGERNKVQQFVNMGFEGGYSASAPTIPLGWTVQSGSLSAGGDYGAAFQFAGVGSSGAISQPAYQDQYGVAILLPNTGYTFRLWASGLGTVKATMYSATVGALATATVNVSHGFTEAAFNVKTSVTIPSDTVLTIESSAVGTVIDELELYYTDNPYLTYTRASYINNPEAFDGISGLVGPANDPNPIRALFERRDVLHLLTSGPDGSLYEASNTPSGEPSTWNIQHISAKCGAISVWGDDKFEDWQVWLSDTGLRIYDGGAVDKMSQEVQPWFDSWNLNAKQFSVLANDPYERRILILAATGTASITNECYQLDYRELNSASALSNSTPLRTGMGGKVYTTDITRKWCPWSIVANFCGLMQSAGGAEMVFCCGTGTVLSDPSFSAVYALGDTNGIDDDYGPFSSFYTTYNFISQDEAQALRLGAHRKLYTYLSMYVQGVGMVVVTPLVDRSGFEWPATLPMPLQPQANFDYECGLNIAGERVAFRIAALPLGIGPTYGATLSLNNFTIAMIDHPFSPIRGTIYG